MKPARSVGRIGPIRISKRKDPSISLHHLR